YPTAPAVDALAAAIAVQLALGWLVLGDHYAPAAFYALELVPTIALTVHHVHRVPRCPVCSDLADVAPPLPWHKEIPVAGAGRAYALRTDPRRVFTSPPADVRFPLHGRRTQPGRDAARTRRAPLDQHRLPA